MAPRRKRKAKAESVEVTYKSPVKVAKQESADCKEKNLEKNEGLQIVIEHW